MLTLFVAVWIIQASSWHETTVFVFHEPVSFGFPFKMYDNSVPVSRSPILALGLIGNLLTVILAGSILGYLIVRKDRT